MKHLFLLLFTFLGLIGYAQFPTISNIGAPKTLVVSKGGLQADSSLVLPKFSDTTSANQSPYIKFYAGNMIRVGDKVWMRNNDATAWISIGSASGYQFMVQVDSSTVLFCRTIGNCDTLQAIPGDTTQIIIDGGGGGINSLAAIGNSPNLNGATIVSDTILRLEPASATFGGVVTVGSQTFEGAKNFLRDIKVNSINIGLGNNNQNFNTRVGDSALSVNINGTANTAIGFKSLKSNTTGLKNSALGSGTLLTNTTGYNNTAIGYQSLLSNTIGYSNTAVGNRSLTTNTTGVQNSAFGKDALDVNTTGYENTAIGADALGANTTGYQNTAIGYNASQSNLSGYSNVAVGTNALYTNTTKSNLVAVGDSSLYKNTSGGQNTAIGSKALYSNTIGSNNTATGFGALYFCDTCVDNTANGLASLFNNIGGDGNTATGFSSLYNNTTGELNSAFGYAAMFKNTTGGYNTAVGNAALYEHKIGNFNTAIGDRSLLFDSTGANNIGIGFGAGFNNKGGHKNVAIGNLALFSNSDSGNVAIGHNSLAAIQNLNSLVRSYNNTALGTLSGSGLLVGQNNILIGYNAQTSNPIAFDEVVIGNSSNNSYTIYAGAWTYASDSSYKHDINPIPIGLDFVKSLKPVEFVYNNSKNNKKSLGFIAQDVKSSMSNPNEYTLVPKMDSTHLGLNTTEIIPILTKAIQQQDEQVQSLKDTLINVEIGGSFTLPDATLFTGTVYVIFKPIYPSELNSIKGEVYDKSLNQKFSISRGTYTFKSDGKNWYQF